jgi:multicomponent Na+:H+ antiporter subunit F
MTLFLTAATAAVLITLALGLVRVLLGPSTADRMLAGQLIGTAGVGSLLLMSSALDEPALIDVALVLALLAAVAVAALTGRAGVRGE